MGSGEYVTTTEEVRDFISKTVWSVAEFDRWLEQVKADAWDEGRNALPVYGDDHEMYCSEYECFCDVCVNPYRQGETK